MRCADSIGAARFSLVLTAAADLQVLVCRG